ncbi:MAG: ABC transporter substrate-binding protein [bacterium]
MSRSKRIIYALLCLSLATVAQCGRGRSKAPKALVIGQANALVRLDPATVTDNESIDVLEQMFEHLVRYAPNSMEPRPALATRWERQADGRTWRFFLREDVRFHDGTPMDADAVVFSFMRQQKDVRTPAGGLKFPYWTSYYRNIVAITRESSHVVRITTDRPFEPLLASLAMFPVSIVSPRAFRKVKPGEEPDPVGTGPFKFVSWDVRSGRIELEANRSYWGPKPKVDRIVFVRIPDARQRLRALQSGLVHIARNLPPELLQLVRLHPDLSLTEMPANNVVYVAMNNDKRPFHDRRVRQAVNYAIRKQALIGLAFQGMAEPAIGPLPPIMVPYYTADVKRYDHDVNRARQLLKEANYDSTLRPKFLVMDSPRAYLPRPILAARMIARDLETIGMTVDLQIMPFAEQKRRLQQGQHHLALHGWSGDNGDPDNFLYNLLDSTNAVFGKLNYAFYREYAFHKLVASARESSDRKERIELYKRAQQVVMITAPWVPLAHAKVVIALRREVGGFLAHPSSILDLRTVELR